MKKIPIKAIKDDIMAHRKTPAPGKYIAYNEFAAYSVGGIGVNTINALFGYVGLSANCLLLGSAYGIAPMDLAFMSLIMNILNLAKTPFISMLIDNTNTKFGKFRPYLLYTGLPAAVLLTAMAFVPNDINYTLKCVLLSIIYFCLMIFQSLYALAFTSLAQVLTPDSQERTSLLSVSQFIYSLGPSIVNILLPVLAGLFPGGMTGFAAYRILFPIFSIIGVLLGIITFKGTTEKIIVPKDYVAKVKFVDGIKEMKNNKYFWLITFYNVLGCMKYGIGSILSWYCIYAIKSETALGIMNAVIGTASVPGMLLAPLLAKKLGKRNCLIFFNIVRAVFTITMFFTSSTPVIFLASLYLATLAIGGDGVITGSVTADVFDYQQWKTGKRLEGFITQFSGMIVTAASMLCALINPWFYERFGLTTDYSVLYEESIRNSIFSVLIITSLISTVLCTVPMLFYNMNEKKMGEIVTELRNRAQGE